MRPDGSPPPPPHDGGNGHGPTPQPPSSAPELSEEQILEEKRHALQRYVERQKQVRKDPPVWGRREMTLTALKTSGLLLLAMLFVFPFLTVSMRERKNDRFVQRLVRDFGQIEATLRAHTREYGIAPEPAPDGSLPPAFVEHFAEMHGGAPFYRHQGEMLRLDVFSPGRQYAEPLRYVTARDRWFVVSRGPTLEFQSPPHSDDVWQAEEFEATLAPFTYDPTNGVESPGDIWITGTN